MLYNPSLYDVPHRLLLLENGVVNYGGGIFRLRAQVHACRRRLQIDDPDTAALLKTVEGYLDGLIAVGGLEEERRVSGIS